MKNDVHSMASRSRSPPPPPPSLVSRVSFLLLFVSFVSFLIASSSSSSLSSSSYSQSVNNPQNAAASSSSSNREVCSKGEELCADNPSFLSIKNLHHQLDDDRDGQVDIEESDEFLREELQYENGKERQKAFHNNKKPITVDELWVSWKKSDVRNWTVEETVEWLTTCVELPEYGKTFTDNAVNGEALPRLAADMHYVAIYLGIKNPIHRRKISLKATDVVLFGPGPNNRGYLKDGILVVSLVVAFGVCWLAYIQHRNSKQELSQMMKDMEGLQRAEESLHALQQELEVARQMQESMSSERDELEKKLHGDGEHEQGSDDIKVQRLEEELNLVMNELQRARRQLESKQWLPPPALQLWLQLTYEMESHNFNMKKIEADEQLKIAKDGCEKLRKKHRTVFGSFRIAHGGSIDDIDEKILLAKAALTELTQILKERLHRWNQIEMMCGFNIVKNPGLAILEPILQIRDSASSAHLQHNGGDLEDMEEEMENNISSHISAVQQLVNASAHMFLASVPQSYPMPTWHDRDMLTRHSPPRRPPLTHRNSSNSLYDSHLSSCIGSASTTSASSCLSSHTVGGPIVPVSTVNPMLSDTKRSRSTGLEHIEKLSQATLKASCSENSLSRSSSTLLSTENVIQEAPTAATASAVTVTNGHSKIFTVGGGPNCESSPEAEERPHIGGAHHKNAAWRKVKSYSQDQSTPPRDVGDGPHSHSDSSLDLRNQGSSTPPPLAPPRRTVATTNNHAAERPKSMNVAAATASVIRSKKLALRTIPPSPVQTTPVDEEKSSDSSSTIDDEVKKENKKKRMFMKLSQKLKRL